MSKRILFILAALALGFAGLYFRTLNAKAAATREDTILAQDRAGTDPAASIADLKTYVSAHMGTSVQFVLTDSYDRALAAAKPAGPSTSQVYADAQRVCSGKSDSITQARCNEAYIQQHLTAAPAPTPLPQPKLADYQYSFKAPLWTSDLPGALFLGAAVALIFAFAGLRRRRRR
jgi:hypothetical protein